MAGKEIHQKLCSTFFFFNLFVACKFFVSVVVIVVVLALTRKTILDMLPFDGKRAIKTTSLVTHREAQKCYLTSKVFLTINSTSVKVMHV